MSYFRVSFASTATRPENIFEKKSNKEDSVLQDSESFLNSRIGNLSSDRKRKRILAGHCQEDQQWPA